VTLPPRTGRTRHVAAAAGGAYRRTTHSGVYLPLDGGEPRQGWDPAALVAERGGLTWQQARDGEQSQGGDIAPGAIDGTVHIQPGTVPASSFDPFPPAVPTGLTLSSEVVNNSDGSSFVRLRVQLVQPPATPDLYGCLVEVTAHNDGAEPPSPVWDRPEEVFIPSSLTSGRLENVQGLTTYWARARSEDVQGNFSGYTTVISHTTVGDTTPPPTPSDPVLTAGFRGFTAYWTGGDAVDRSHYEIRYAAGASAPVDDSWTYGIALASIVWVGNLTPDTLYWVQVRSIDRSSNFSGWSTAMSVTPSLVGSADLAVASVSAALGHIADLNANQITAGTLKLKPSGTAVAIQVLTIDDVLVIDLQNDGTMKFIDPTNPSRYLFIQAGEIKFTTDNGVNFPAGFTPEGIDAGAIRFGESQGGHNLLLNSSFELSGLVAAPSTAVFTDNDVSPVPGWHANHRTSALVNLSEGAADLQITAMAY